MYSELTHAVVQKLQVEIWVLLTKGSEIVDTRQYPCIKIYYNAFTASRKAHSVPQTS